MRETKVFSITTSFKLVEGKVEVLAAAYFVAMEGFLLTDERKTLFRYHIRAEMSCIYNKTLNALYTILSHTYRYKPYNLTYSKEYIYKNMHN